MPTGDEMAIEGLTDDEWDAFVKAIAVAQQAFSSGDFDRVASCLDEQAVGRARFRAEAVKSLRRED